MMTPETFNLPDSTEIISVIVVNDGQIEFTFDAGGIACRFVAVPELQ